MKLSKELLEELYTTKKLSQMEISLKLDEKYHKVRYWIEKYGIPRRTISEAVYQKLNPSGDPFKIKEKLTAKERELKGIGIGLYWGEGTRSNKTCIRLGNTDPKLIKKFIEFLEIIYGINSNKLKFGLQIFNDMDAQESLKFWSKELNVRKNQFQKVIITPARSIGTYKNKTKHGVLTVHYNNRKLRDILICNIAKVAQSAEHDYGKVGVAGSIPALGLNE